MMDVEVKDPVVKSAINDIIRIINNIENYDATFYYLNDFTVNIIPYTWENTTFKFIKVGDWVNTEIDMLARYAFKALGAWKK